MRTACTGECVSVSVFYSALRGANTFIQAGCVSVCMSFLCS